MTQGAPRSAFQDQSPEGQGRGIPPNGGVRTVMEQGGHQCGRGFGYPGTHTAMDAYRRQGEYTARGTKEGPPQEAPSRPMSDRPHPDPWDQAGQGFRDAVAEPVDPNATWDAHLRAHLDQHTPHSHISEQSKTVAARHMSTSRAYRKHMALTPHAPSRA